MNIKSLKKNDTGVYRQIVETYWPRLNKFAQIYTQNSEVSEELVQDALLILWEKRNDLRDDTCIITYLMVVLRNKCLNHLKQIKIRTMSIDEMDIETIYHVANTYALEDDVSEMLETEDLQQIINKALEVLPVKTREVFCMSRMNGMKNKEIAKSLNLSLKTIEFHITKALRHIRTRLSKEYAAMFLFFLYLS